MEEDNKLCLNLYKVRDAMRRNEISRKDLGEAIGMKDPHTIAYYFKHPDRIRLSHVTAIAQVLGCTPYLYDEFVVRIKNDDEFDKMISGGN